MGLTATIAHKVGLLVIERSGLELLDIQAARTVLDVCAHERVIVLGIEGFRMQAGEEIVPDLSAIADFSTLSGLALSERITQSVADAKAFLDTVTNSGGLLFELTLTQETVDEISTE